MWLPVFLPSRVKVGIGRIASFLMGEDSFSLAVGSTLLVRSPVVPIHEVLEEDSPYKKAPSPVRLQPT